MDKNKVVGSLSPCDPMHIFQLQIKQSMAIHYLPFKYKRIIIELLTFFLKFHFHIIYISTIEHGRMHPYMCLQNGSWQCHVCLQLSPNRGYWHLL